MRRKGYAGREYEMAVNHQKKRARQRRAEAVAVIGAFGAVAFWVYWCLWMWANGYVGG